MGKLATSKTRQKTTVGKRIGGYIYIHRSAKEALSQGEQDAVNKAEKFVPATADWSVVKIEEHKHQRISFLDYEDFEKSAFPAPLQSCSVDLRKGDATVRRYSKANPPILHRKELLLRFNDPRRDGFAKKTRRLEELGLFKEMHKMGHKKQWSCALAQSGLDPEGNPLVEC